jgi:hypothetical protein
MSVAKLRVRAALVAVVRALGLLAGSSRPIRRIRLNLLLPLAALAGVFAVSAPAFAAQRLAILTELGSEGEAEILGPVVAPGHPAALNLFVEIPAISNTAQCTVEETNGELRTNQRTVDTFVFGSPTVSSCNTGEAEVTGGRLTEVTASAEKRWKFRFSPPLEIAERTAQGHCVYRFGPRVTIVGMNPGGPAFPKPAFLLLPLPNDVPGKLRIKQSNVACFATQTDHVQADPLQVAPDHPGVFYAEVLG